MTILTFIHVDSIFRKKVSCRSCLHIQLLSLLFVIIFTTIYNATLHSLCILSHFFTTFLHLSPRILPNRLNLLLIMNFFESIFCLQFFIFYLCICCERLIFGSNEVIFSWNKAITEKKNLLNLTYK